MARRTRSTAGARPCVRSCSAGLRVAVALAALAAGPAGAQEHPAVAPAAGAAAAEPAPPPVETAWVSGEVRVNFRASPAAGATPLGIVTTGEEVVVLERKGGWARVRVASGAAGWVSESLLAAEAPPVERVAQLEAELGAVREELSIAQRELETIQRRDEEREARAQEREAAFAELEAENRDLRAGERWPYMVTGASILGAGLTAGFLMRGGASRRGGGGRIRF
jgi:uncharacterized protein YgiM (DUF1202 family)